MERPLFVQGLEKLSFQEESPPLHTVKTAYGDIVFTMFGQTTEFRVRTFFTKEPETRVWIDSFEPEDVFWDIGANIGCYSLYAASRNDLTVCAFEPSPVNYWLLSTNVINNFRDSRVVAYPFGLSNSSSIVKWAPHTSAGSAENQLDHVGNAAVQVYSIDDLIEVGGAPFPNHIKLDVDGIESMILAGAKKTLSDGRLKSLMIEVDEANSDDTNSIVSLLMSHGFAEPIKRHPPYFDRNHYLPMGNYLFKRINNP